MRAFVMALKVLLVILGIWIALAALGLIAAHLSGRVKRAYAVLPPDQELEIAGVKKDIAMWAEDFRPIVMLRSINNTPPLLRTVYEVVERENAAYFIYYQVWEDEVHPNPLYHRVYRLFRAAYYGSPVRDIEYFEVKVNRLTGKIDQLMFETSPANDYNIALSEHLIAYVTLLGTGDYSLRLTRKNGDPVSKDLNITVFFEGLHTLTGPITWNHLTTLIDPNDTSFDIRVTAPLGYLTTEEYSLAKFARKSHGTFKTEEKGISAAAGLLGLLAFVIPLGLIARMAGWTKEKIGMQSRSTQGS